ncbi:MAG: serine/threonine protein kinase, partial [Leptolyngbyaceae cyanobacterium CRU_2_3]|nr:serine/threonine protein kinase [Leptolyngbyaceae cyanobacterium CRU_2_3]
LTEQVLQKTQGNPFFTNQFLKFLYQDGLISFDYDCGYWQCDIAQVRSLAVSLNVVEFMAGQLQKLPEPTQAVLQLAACIGNQFDLAILAIAYGKSSAETAVDLWGALQEGLVLPTSEIYRFYQGSERVEQWSHEDVEFSVPYKFLHDRVQQAAYSLIPAPQKQATHLKIGQLLLQNTSPAERDDRIFEIVNQLNMGVELIFQPAERQELAQLNLLAGQKARASTAYESATEYLEVGMTLLPAESWQQHYSLTLGLYETAAEVAYLNGRFEKMEKLADTVLLQSPRLLDKIKTYEVKIQAYASQNKPLESVLTALQIFQFLGVRFSQKPGSLKILQTLIGTKLTLLGKRIETLSDLPEMTEPEQLAILRIIRSVGSPAYNATPELMPLLAFKAVNLSLQYGNTAESAYGYASYGVILCGVLEDIEQGYQFGKLALAVLERFNAKAIQAKTIFVVTNFINHWKQPVTDGLKLLLNAYQVGLETGDVEFAAYSAYIYCYHSYFLGRDLSELEPEMVAYRHVIAQLSQEVTLNLLDLYRQAVLNLMGRSPDPCRLVGAGYDEVIRLQQALDANHKTAIFDIYFQKLILNYLFERYAEAAENAALAAVYIDGARASLSIPLFYFYDSLIRLAHCSNLPQSEQKSSCDRLPKTRAS